MAGANKEAKDLAKRLRKLGYSVSMAHNGHYRVTRSDGSQLGQFACSPGDVRTVKNAVARLRRAGAAL